MSPPAKASRSACGDARPLVADVARPGQRQPARGEQLDDLGQVLVLALAGEDFVADDDEADVHAFTLDVDEGWRVRHLGSAQALQFGQREVREPQRGKGEDQRVQPDRRPAPAAARRSAWPRSAPTSSTAARRGSRRRRPSPAAPSGDARSSEVALVAAGVRGQHVVGRARGRSASPRSTAAAPAPAAAPATAARSAPAPAAPPWCRPATTAAPATRPRRGVPPGRESAAPPPGRRWPASSASATSSSDTTTSTGTASATTIIGASKVRSWFAPIDSSHSSIATVRAQRSSVARTPATAGSQKAQPSSDHHAAGHQQRQQRPQHQPRVQAVGGGAPEGIEHAGQASHRAQRRLPVWPSE